MGSEMSGTDWLVFDLGGVLTNFDGVTELSKLTGRSQLEIHDALISNAALFEFETGNLTPTNFAERFVAEMDLPISAKEALELWTNCEAGPKPGALEYVSRLRDDWRIACLSNISTVHWERLCDRYGVHKLFEYTFVSFEIGLHKPDKRIFEHVTQALNTSPEKIKYFDDRRDIVDAATEHGFDAYQTNSPEDVATALQNKAK